MQEHINRVLNIDWNKIGSNTDKSLNLLGYEFFRRLAKFINDNNFKPIWIRFASVVAYLVNDFKLCDSKNIFKKYATQSMIDRLNCSLGKDIIGYYFQLVEYSIENPSAEQYFDIYEPLIKLWEVGGDIYDNRHRMLEIYGVCAFPYDNYVSRFKDIQPKDISQFYK